MHSWLVLQLADSAFPVGGFAHSGGLEAMHQAGHVPHARALEAFCRDAIVQAGHALLPLIAAAYDTPQDHARWDALTRATTWSHVAARASRAQGRALLDATIRAFCTPLEIHPSLLAAREAVHRGDVDGHFAPMLGVVGSALALTRDDTLVTALHGSLRATLSAAVRLGVLGPFEAQALQARLGGAQSDALVAARTRGPDALAQTAPLTEAFQAAHDRQYSRLFQS